MCRRQAGSFESIPRAFRYAGPVAAPSGLYVLFFFVLVGFEELIGIITEELAMSFLLLVALGVAISLMSTLLFSVTPVFVRSPDSNPRLKAGRPERKAEHRRSSS